MKKGLFHWFFNEGKHVNETLFSAAATGNGERLNQIMIWYLASCMGAWFSCHTNGTTPLPSKPIISLLHNMQFDFQTIKYNLVSLTLEPWKDCQKIWNATVETQSCNHWQIQVPILHKFKLPSCPHSNWLRTQNQKAIPNKKCYPSQNSNCIPSQASHCHPAQNSNGNPVKNINIFHSTQNLSHPALNNWNFHSAKGPCRHKKNILK